jgi:hypothetical protein
MPAGLFGITDETVNLVVNLIILFLIVLWLALIAWTFFDARRRIEDPVLVAFATAASFFPYVGTMVYSILRPPDYRDDRRERELEIRAAELRVRQLEEQSCPNCEHPLERTFLRCPNCRARIKHPCPSCAEPVDPRWSLCPYCEAALRRAPAERRVAPAEKLEPGERAAQPAERRSQRSERRVAGVPKSQRPQQSKPEPARRAANPKRTRKAATSSSEDGGRGGESEREPRATERNERSKSSSARRTSTRPRS